MKEKLALYWMAFNTALQAKFEYRVDMVLGVLTSCMLQLSALGLLWIVFSQTPRLNDWTPEQVVLLFGVMAASLGTSELLFNHIWMLPYYVVMGELDRLMTYPVDSLYFLLITRPELHSFGNLFMGYGLAGLALVRLHAPLEAWLLLPLCVLCGSVMYTSALVIFGSLSFRFIGPTSMHFMIPHVLLQATRYPLSIFPGWLQYALMFLLPYGAFNYLPAGLLLDKGLAPWLFLAAPLAAVLFVLEARACWKWGINQYESTGS
ncbi:MAG TPA: ABC-2 family transporter protein [bacterium]|nr:ABC-2 family transporter protein [bacterium]